MARPANRKEDEGEKRRLEAIAAILGGALALGTLGTIAWDAIDGDGPPVVLVERLAVHPNERGFLLEIGVSNTGGRTASQLVVEGTLSRGGSVVETSETTFDYVAAGSHRRGGLFFSADPSAFDVELRAKGYVRP